MEIIKSKILLSNLNVFFATTAHPLSCFLASSEPPDSKSAFHWEGAWVYPFDGSNRYGIHNKSLHTERGKLRFLVFMHLPGPRPVS